MRPSSLNFYGLLTTQRPTCRLLSAVSFIFLLFIFVFPPPQRRADRDHYPSGSLVLSQSPPERARAEDTPGRSPAVAGQEQLASSSLANDDERRRLFRPARFSSASAAPFVLVYLSQCARARALNGRSKSSVMPRERRPTLAPIDEKRESPSTLDEVITIYLTIFLISSLLFAVPLSHCLSFTFCRAPTEIQIRFRASPENRACVFLPVRGGSMNSSWKRYIFLISPKIEMFNNIFVTTSGLRTRFFDRK